MKELLMAAEEIDVEKYLMDLVIDKKIVVKKSEEGNRVYSDVLLCGIEYCGQIKRADIREDYQEKQIEKKINVHTFRHTVLSHLGMSGTNEF